MTFTVGTQLGSLEITGMRGKGGMGEVYRERDMKLKREVAIKILPGAKALDNTPTQETLSRSSTLSIAGTQVVLNRFGNLKQRVSTH